MSSEWNALRTKLPKGLRSPTKCEYLKHLSTTASYHDHVIATTIWFAIKHHCYRDTPSVIVIINLLLIVSIVASTRSELRWRAQKRKDKMEKYGERETDSWETHSHDGDTWICYCRDNTCVNEHNNSNVDIS